MAEDVGNSVTTQVFWCDFLFELNPYPAPRAPGRIIQVKLCSDASAVTCAVDFEVVLRQQAANVKVQSIATNLRISQSPSGFPSSSPPTKGAALQVFLVNANP